MNSSVTPHPRHVLLRASVGHQCFSAPACRSRKACVDTDRTEGLYAARPSSLCVTLAPRFFDLWQRHDSHKTQGERAVLSEAEVVGMTTTGVAMHQDLVESLGAAIVVVEEAAEVRRRRWDTGGLRWGRAVKAQAPVAHGYAR